MARLLPTLLLLAWTAPVCPAFADESSKATADALMREGRALYRQGKYRRAAARFERGHAIHPDPSFLFNLGKCHQRLGENDAAIVDFVGYLIAAPDAEDRADVEAAIRALGGEPPPPPAPAPPVTEELPAEPAAPPPKPPHAAVTLLPESLPASEPTVIEAPPTLEAVPADDRTDWRWAAWTTLGVGAVSTSLGVLFLVQARNAADDANACIEDAQANAPCQEDIDRHGNRRILAGLGLSFGAAALIGGGAWLYVLGDADYPARADLDVRVAPGEAFATAQLRY